jgi:hypothetical protein
MLKVSSFLDEARAALRYRRPALAVLQAFGEPVGTDGLMPTPAELRCMTYLALVHEARGIIFFSYSYNGPMRENNPAQWREIKKCATEIRDLAPALAGSSGDLVANQTPDSKQVHTRVIRNGEAAYVIAVNTQRTPMSRVKWTTRGFADGTLEVIGEDREVTMRNSVFEDDFGPLAVHVYRGAAQADD